MFFCEQHVFEKKSNLFTSSFQQGFQLIVHTVLTRRVDLLLKSGGKSFFLTYECLVSRPLNLVEKQKNINKIIDYLR
jgi:hypothetical protein